MTASWWRVICVLPILVGANEVVAAAPPKQQEPGKGAISKGIAMTSVCDESLLSLWTQSLRDPKAVKDRILGLAVDIPARWHVGHGGLWFAASSCGLAPGPGSAGPSRYEFDDLLRGRMVPAPGAKEYTKFLPPGFALSIPLSDCRFMAQVAKFPAVVHYDYLPVGRFRTNLFVVTNLEAQGESAGKGEKLSARLFPRDGQEKPHWSFVCHSVRARWSLDDDSWEPGEWSEPVTLELAFREPFQALSRGEDYYFVTASGKLFRAPKPAKGTHRKLETIWDDAESRIVAHIHDADRNRTFLFCDKGPKGVGGPIVFELGSGVRPRFYDKALYKEGDQGPKQLRRVVGYARVLETLGYIKHPAKAPAAPSR